MRASRLVLWSSIAVLAAAAVAGYWIFVRPEHESSVPTRDGRRCEIWEGDSEEAVLAMCGPPCATARAPKGPCKPRPHWPSEWFEVELCSNKCAIYRDVYACYGVGVVSVGQVTASSAWYLRPCQW